MVWQLKFHGVEAKEAKKLATAVERFWDGLMPTNFNVLSFPDPLPADWSSFWNTISQQPWTLWFLNGSSKRHHGYSLAAPHNVAWVRQASPLGWAPFHFLIWTANHEVAHIYTGGAQHCSSPPSFCILSQFADIPSYFTHRLFRKLCPKHQKQLISPGGPDA